MNDAVWKQLTFCFRHFADQRINFWNKNSLLEKEYEMNVIY